jgi:hypothetical protein
MATTTTNYGWDIPQSTDLVKDGATAIALLGQDIDTSMNTALAGKKAGMVLLNTTSFSGVSSVSLPADTFTSTYDNYCLIGIYTSNQSTQTALTGRMRAAGSDNTTSNYGVTNANQGTDNAVSYQSTTAQTSWTNIQRLRDIPHRFEMILFAPKLTERTTFNFRGTGINSANNLFSMTNAAGEFGATTSFDSISFIAGTGTLTGTISCYGFND